MNGTAGDASVITTGGSSTNVAQNGTVAGATDVQAQYESLKTKYRVSLSQSLILQCIQILSPNLIFVYTMNFQGSIRLSQLKLFLIAFKPN